MDKALEVNERRRAMAEKSGDDVSLIAVHTGSGFIFAESGKLEDAAKQFEKADQFRNGPSLARSEERRVGKECRRRWARNSYKQIDSQLLRLFREAGNTDI